MQDKTGENGWRYCVAELVPDAAAAEKFKDRSVAALFPKGASNPIRYFYPPKKG